MDSAISAPHPAAAVDYPVRVELDAPNEIARWRPIAHFFMAIPHFIIMNALEMLTAAVTFVAFFAIVFTKRYPEGLFRFAVMVQRYNWRVMSFALYLREPYPAFEFPMELQDPGTDPARYSIEYPGDQSRWLPFVRIFLVIPHMFAFVFLAVGVAFVLPLSFLAVIVTGRYPEGMRSFMEGTVRWMLRVGAYFGLLTDRYPPFSLR